MRGARPFPFGSGTSGTTLSFVPNLLSLDRQVPSGSTVTAPIEDGHSLRIDSKYLLGNC